MDMLHKCNEINGEEVMNFKRGCLRGRRERAEGDRGGNDANTVCSCVTSSKKKKQI